MEAHLADLSRFLSYVLRHSPDDIGLSLNKEGWANIDDIIEKSAHKGKILTKDVIGTIVSKNDKARFELSADGLRIRAVQGHSTSQVDRTFKVQVPPVVLFHGTATKFIASIRKKGLIPKSRHYVHLSGDRTTAHNVGQRHGDVVILEVDCKAMLKDGHKFRLSENGVWLTEAVPVKYLKFP